MKDDKEILKKLQKSLGLDEDDKKKLQKIIDEDDAKKSLKQLMERYKYTPDELKEILNELE